MLSGRLRFALVPLFVLSLAAGIAHGAGGKAFAGVYRHSAAPGTADPVLVALSVRLYNYSGSDVSQGSITLESGGMPAAALATLPSISVADRKSVDLAAEVSLPRREYLAWQAGASPQLRIAYRDAAGQARSAVVALAPMRPGEQ